jgi:hypothetical protein
MKKINAPWFEEAYMLKVKNWIKEMLREEQRYLKKESLLKRYK